MNEIILNDAGPASEPVTLAQCQEHLRLPLTGSPASHADDDRITTFLIPTARQMVEAYTNRALIERTFIQYLQKWPTRGDLLLTRAPLSSVTSVEYIATAGASYSTVSTDVYGVDTDATPGRLYLKASQDWPSPDDIRNTIKITYVAGYGSSASDVPEALRSAVLMLVAHLYENPEATTTLKLDSVPWGVRALLGPYRVWQR